MLSAWCSKNLAIWEGHAEFSGGVLDDTSNSNGFGDLVRAGSAENASALICELRPYVVRGRIADVAELGKMAKRVKSAKTKTFDTQLDAIAAVESSSGDAGTEKACTSWFDPRRHPPLLQRAALVRARSPPANSALRLVVARSAI